MYNKLCYLCFLCCNVNVHPQNHFSFSIRVEQLSWNIGFSVTLAENFKKKIGIFPYCSTRKTTKNFANCYRITKLTKLAEFGRTLTNTPF